MAVVKNRVTPKWAALINGANDNLRFFLWVYFDPYPWESLGDVPKQLMSPSGGVLMFTELAETAGRETYETDSIHSHQRKMAPFGL